MLRVDETRSLVHHELCKCIWRLNENICVTQSKNGVTVNTDVNAKN